jgi:hypothetical protein
MTKEMGLEGYGSESALGGMATRSGNVENINIPDKGSGACAYLYAQDKTNANRCKRVALLNTSDG